MNSKSYYKEKRMKLLTALFFGLSSAALAQPSQQSTFAFNQANIAINLEQKDFETIYRTDQVPDTCYRDEIQGTRTECHTEYDRQCHTQYENVCRSENYPVCTTIQRRECHTSNQCTTEMDRVCNSRGCTNIPRRVCRQVQQCSNVPDRVCHTQSRTVCNNVPREYCQNIPRQVCINVPNIVKVPYACTRPVQVPIGQQLKLHTVAQIAVNLLNFSEVGQTPDILIAQLENGTVTISAQNESTNAFLYQVVGQQRSEQMVSATEKVVKYSLSISATSIQKLNAFLDSEITNAKLFYDRVEFKLSGAIKVPFKGHLKIVQFRRIRSDLIMIDNDFGAVEKILFKNFGVDSLNSADHSVELSLQVDLALLRNGLLNPGAISQVSNKSVLSSFEAFPSE